MIFLIIKKAIKTEVLIAFLNSIELCFLLKIVIVLVVKHQKSPS